METNDSEGTNPTSYEEGSGNRYSKRVRKPIQLFLPEVAQNKSKKRNFDVKCEILKSKGIPGITKNLNFSVNGNFSACNIVRKFLRKIKSEMTDHKLIYFCEQTQKWKRLKNSDILSLGTTYKIRAYKPKKMEKKDLGQIKRTEKKMAEKPKPNPQPVNRPSVDQIGQNVIAMNMYYYYMATAMMNAMTAQAYNYYPPF